MTHPEIVAAFIRLQLRLVEDVHSRVQEARKAIEGGEWRDAPPKLIRVLTEARDALNSASSPLLDARDWLTESLIKEPPPKEKP